MNASKKSVKKSRSVNQLMNTVDKKVHLMLDNIVHEVTNGTYQIDHLKGEHTQIFRKIDEYFGDSTEISVELKKLFTMKIFIDTMKRTGKTEKKIFEEIRENLRSEAEQKQ